MQTMKRSVWFMPSFSPVPTDFLCCDIQKSHWIYVRSSTVLPVVRQSKHFIGCRYGQKIGVEQTPRGPALAVIWIRFFIV